MRISVGSDHAGYAQKEQLVEYLKAKGFDVTDRGTFSEERVDYPDYAIKVAMDVSFDRADCGVLVCGTGIGMSITANKVPRVRAANVTSVDFAKLARQHNDANVLTLSGRFVDLDTNKAILDAFLETDFEGGRHQQRIDKIAPLDIRRPM